MRYREGEAPAEPPSYLTKTLCGTRSTGATPALAVGTLVTR